MEFELHPNLQRDGIVLGQFPLCLVLLINDSSYPWYVLVPRRSGMREAYELAADDYSALCDESRVFGQALMKLHGADKLNVAALGNMTPQLHVHHVVRFKADAAWPGPIWGKQALVPYDAGGIENRRNELGQLELPGFVVTT